MADLRVLIVDDDPLVLVGLQYLMRTLPDIEVVAQASDGAEILSLLQAFPADVVLSDIRMPRTNGMSMIPAIRAHHPQVRVVLMSAAPTAAVEPHVLNAGADAYISKTSTPAQIHAAIVGATAAPVTRQPRPLTDREEAVAARVAMGESNITISVELGISINSVKTYVSRAMTKLGVANRVQLANVINSRL